MVDPAAAGVERLGIVELKRSYAYRFGVPNDEVWHGHPLHGRGLEFYCAHLIVNSPWIAAERAVNGVHSQFREERWDRLRHYFLLFHDQVFECLAEDHECELHEATFANALEIVAKRLVTRGQGAVAMVHRTEAASGIAKIRSPSGHQLMAGVRCQAHRIQSLAFVEKARGGRTKPRGQGVLR